jgi:chromosome condensin MukBEF ATPase and DNA-binding subunit MukB
MGLWNRIKTLRNNDKMIELYKEEVQTYQCDLKQQNKLLSQYMEKEIEYQKNSDEKTQSIQQLQQKLKEYEQKLAEFEQREIGYKRQLNQMSMNNTKPRKRIETPVSEGHYKIMEKIAQQFSNEQQSSASPQKTQQGVQTIASHGSRNCSSNQSSNHSVQFNPFKNQQRR